MLTTTPLIWLPQRKKWAIHIILEEDRGLNRTLIQYSKKTFILHWFYLSSQTALTGSSFVIYGHWPRYHFSGTQFMLSDRKKQEQYKCRHNSIPILLWWHKIILKYDLCWHNVSSLNMWNQNNNFCTSLLQTYLIKHTPLTSLASESMYSLSIHITVLNYNQLLFLVIK